MAGLTQDGFLALTLQEILDAIEADQQANIDPNLNQETDSVVGQLNAIMAQQVQTLWELAQQIFQSTFPDDAVGIPLSNLAALTGVVRRPATSATVLIKLVGTVSTLIPAGTLVSVEGDSASQFEFVTDHTLLTASADEVTVVATTPGSAPNATTTDTGVIDTPVSGFDSFTFATNAERGLDTETDSELRARRELELARPGTGTVPAVEADLAQVAEVDSVTVFENTNVSPADATGLPIHNIEAVVGGGVGNNEQAIAEQLWESKPAGIGTFGGDSRTVTDTAGNQHVLFFSRPTQVPTQMELTVVRDVVAVTDEEIRQALEDWASTWKLGEDVTIAGIVEIVMGLSGVLNVPTTDVLIGTKTPPTLLNQDLIITDRDIATLAAGDVVIN